MKIIKPMAPPMKMTTSPKKFAMKICIRLFLRFAISDVINALSGKKSKNPPVCPIKSCFFRAISVAIKPITNV